MGNISVKIAVVLVAILGVGLTGLLYKKLQHSKSQYMDFIVSSTSEHYQKILQTKLNALFQEMEIAQHLYQSSNVISPSTFSVVAQPMVQKSNGLMALEWIPRIAQHELQAHQKTAKASGLKNYFIREKNLSDNFTAVLSRPYYYPVYLSEPKNNHASIQGYDIGSNPDRLSALLQAMEKNTTIATAPLTLLQNNLAYDGFLVFKPVYHHSTSLETIEARVKHLKGFIVGVFSINELINSAFDFIDKPLNIVSLNDITEPISYNTASSPAHNAWTRSNTLSIANHSWKLSVTLRESDIDSIASIRPLTALLMGSIVTILSVLSIYFIGSRMTTAKQIIINQTLELQKNDQLKRSVFNAVSNAVITVNAKGEIKTINPATESIFGYHSKEVIGENISLFIPSPHSRLHDQYMSQYIRTGKSNVVGHKRNVEGCHKLGHIVPLELSITEIDSGAQAIFCVVAQDLSIQMASEKLSKRLLEITRLSPDFIATFDAEGTLIFANDPARKALGCASDKDISKHHLDNIFPSSANDFFQKSKRYPDYLHSWIGESVFVTAQGQATSVSQLLLSHPCDRNETQYYTVFMRDITEDKKSQIELRKAKQAAEFTANSQRQLINTLVDNIQIPNADIQLSIKQLYDTNLDRIQIEYVTKLHVSERNIHSILEDIQTYQNNATGHSTINSISSNNSNYDHYREETKSSTADYTQDMLTSIDPEILNGLKATMSSKDYKDIIPRYVSDTEKNIASMCTACKEKHFQDIEKIAQKIKSSSADIGIHNLSNLADSLEHDIHEHQFEKVSTLINDIQHEFSVVKNRLHNEYKTQHKAG